LKNNKSAASLFQIWRKEEPIASNKKIDIA